MSNRWSPGIGDPSVVGWLTVAAYLATAILCVRAAHDARAVARDRRRSAHLQAPFWTLLAAAFLLLGINKQLDLQSLLTQAARDLAKAQGWYEGRRAYQLAFIEAVVASAVAASLIAAWMLRRAPPAVKLAAAGFALTLGYVVIRAVSFHHVDRFIGQEVVGVRWNWVLELAGIGVVAFAAHVYRVRRRRPAPPVREGVR